MACGRMFRREAVSRSTSILSCRPFDCWSVATSASSGRVRSLASSFGDHCDKLGFIGVLQRVLVLGAADAAVDLDVLHRLHEQRDALDVLGRLAQPVNDFADAGAALVARFEIDVEPAGVDGGVDRARADKRGHADHVRVLTHDLGDRRAGARPWP